MLFGKNRYPGNFLRTINYGDGPSAKIPIPTEQDVDKLFDYVEGMVKKLKERLKRLEEQKDKDTQL